MAKINIREWLVRLGRLLEGAPAPRKLTPAPPLLLDATVALPSAPQVADRIDVVEQAGPILDRAKILRTFDSAHPVRKRNELFGREEQLYELLSATLDLGQHAIVHGARGSGKTSLVRVFGDYADQRGAVVIYLACEPQMSFADLVRPYLQALPAAAIALNERSRFREELDALPSEFGPRDMVELVSERVSRPTLFIFDEFDRVTDPAVKAEVAAAMKLLADSLSSVLFMLVGIARDVADVVRGHPSLRRHMHVVAIGRIEPTSVEALIDAGEIATGLTFEAGARHVIARVSCGSPFHVRMFCHHSAISSLARGSTSVEQIDARAGLRSALRQWASMNVDDARRFVTLVEDPALRPELERVVRAAALADRLPADNDATYDILAGALAPDGSDTNSLVFQDSVAPQFLIAYVILMEGADPGAVKPFAREGY